MKDFTKTQQSRSVSLKCNRCSEVVKAFGIEPGDKCMGTPNMDGGMGASMPNTPCSGKYIPFDGREADAIKRRTDGAA